MKNTLNLSSLSGRFKYGDRIRPHRDWFSLLSLAFTFILLSAGWNLWLFLTVERGGTIGTETATNATFDAAPVESVRDVFETRRLEELRYKQEYRFIDPQQSGG